MLKSLRTIFVKNNQHPQPRYIYAITAGTYVGEMWVLVDPSKTVYGFLSMPKMEKRTVPKENFDEGLQKKVIDIIERLPYNVYKICVKQYKNL